MCSRNACIRYHRIVGQSAVNRVIVATGRRFRARRMARFAQVLDWLNDKRILDIGGSERFWRQWPGADVTLLNVHFIDVAERPRIQADATSTGLCDDAYDIAFSNSVLEHLGSWERQEAFAREVSRVAPAYWVQTPARGFPVDPHLMAAFVHWLPKRWQHRLARFTPWALLCDPDPELRRRVVDELRLLTADEVRRLFPDATIERERVLGLTKSYVAYRVEHGVGRVGRGSAGA